MIRQPRAYQHAITASLQRKPCRQAAILYLSGWVDPTILTGLKWRRRTTQRQRAKQRRQMKQRRLRYRNNGGVAIAAHGLWSVRRDDVGPRVQ
ncbi:hypothetical protein BDZ89DRAFT_633237 [Hymenopellis radicata]|nr:hypothetical protein BDZ89DRAFT_633237 [Hymenopellis radicata]